MKDPDIRTNETLDFYPQRKTEKHIYNTFKGFDGMKAPDNKNDFKILIHINISKITFVKMMLKKKNI